MPRSDSVVSRWVAFVSSDSVLMASPVMLVPFPINLLRLAPFADESGSNHREILL